jgi:hypothetical protein
MVKRFFAPVQSGPGAHLVYWDSVYHLLPSRDEVKERVERYF